ncbi:MAG: gliding motility protein GldB [Tannerellaceae bacterium]
MIFTLILSVTLLSCNGQTADSARYASAEPIQIHRFDKEVYRLIDTDDSTLQAQISHQYPQMLAILAQGILNMQTPDAPGFFDKLVNYYSEPTLKGLYRDAVRQYDSIAPLEQELGSGFAWLKDNFPAMQVPAVYMHISGLNQNILVGDSLLSVSIDKYMGADYPLYQDFFYNEQRRKMQPAYIAADCLTGWLLSEYPFEGKENVLLDRMIYEGKIKYLVQHALPAYTSPVLMGYAEPAFAWCEANEAALWKTIVERKQLFTPDLTATAKYFEGTPCTFLAVDAPANIGTWIGWQIVNSYMSETNATPLALMQNNNYQEILASSKYKP